MNKKICIIGLGYVGLPLAHAFSKKYQVVGFDINKPRVEELRSGYDRTLELTDDEVKESITNGMVYSTNIDDIKDCNVYIVTVPTPIDSSNRPDLTPLIKSSQTIGKVLKKDDIVIYESTVYPGVTEEVCVPELECESGMIFNKDFFCGYSPERINPGDKEHTVTKILKITSGSNPEIAIVVDELYKSIITAGTHKASSIKVAEAAKVIENTQRDVNIALINELALIFDTMNINTNDVIEAAATKWNFIKLKPGLVGGHCIGVDPYYLTYKAMELGYEPYVILGGRKVNDNMAFYVARRCMQKLIEAGKNLTDSRILVMGLTFKENVSDIRNSKVADLVQELLSFGLHVDVTEPNVSSEEVNAEYNFGLLEQVSDKYDAIIIAVAHKEYLTLEEEYFLSHAKENCLLIDIKGIYRNKFTKFNYWSL